MKNYILIIFAVIAIGLSSCGPSAVVVRTRPEPPIYSRPYSPGPNYVWVDGEWIWRGNQYVYKQGYWAPIRRKNDIYVQGHWRAGKGGWYWVPGHWK
jgi:hypothetical protein